jgi:SAM-dependent methyltransferase
MAEMANLLPVAENRFVPSDARSTPDAVQVAAYFDGLYRPVERYWWRRADPYSPDPEAYPTSLLTQMTLRLLGERAKAGADDDCPRRVLDLGAGEGADSIRLALLGYEAIAVDVSAEATRKIRRFAAQAGVDVTVVTADIGEYIPEGQFDIIICNGVLQYIRDKVTVIGRMQAATRAGGLNVLSAWSTYSPVPASHNSVPVYCDDEDGAIMSAYRGWHPKLVYFEHNKPEESHAGMPEHSHSHIKIIAEKPGL